MTIAHRPLAGLGAEAARATGASGWMARTRRWIEERVADPEVQRRLAAFPLTRPFVLRRSRELFDLVAGFVYTQTLVAVLQLGLLDAVAGDAQDAAGLAARLGLPLDAMERLLGAAASLGLLARGRDGRYRLGVLGMPLRGRPEIATLVEHNRLLYADLANPVALLRAERGGSAELAKFWAYGAQGPGAVEGSTAAGYSAVMSASIPLVLEDILDTYPFHRHRVLLDVGGGEGRFVRAVARRAPNLRLMLLDLPPVAERARVELEAAGLGHRVTVHGGSFASDPLPTGADVLSLVRVVHDHDDDVVRSLFARAREVLPRRGVLVVGEPMAGLSASPRVGDAYFAFYLLAMGSGRARTPDELRGMLREAGFRRTRFFRPRTPVQTGVVVAEV